MIFGVAGDGKSSQNDDKDSLQQEVCSKSLLEASGGRCWEDFGVHLGL